MIFLHDGTITFQIGIHPHIFRIRVRPVDFVRYDVYVGVNFFQLFPIGGVHSSSFGLPTDGAAFPFPMRYPVAVFRPSV